MTTMAATNGQLRPEGRVARYHHTTAMLGMTIFIASWAMLFAGLFFAYGIIRVRALAWPPADLPKLPVGVPAIGSVFLALSSVFLQRALAGARQDERAGKLGALIGTAGALGAVFLALQTLVWRQQWFLGLRPETGTYASVFYGLTVFHAVHVLVGLGALLLLTIAALRGKYSAGAHIPLRLWTAYWHMVGVIWAVMFVLVYVL